MIELELRYLRAQGFDDVPCPPSPHGPRPRLDPGHLNQDLWITALGIEYHPVLALPPDAPAAWKLSRADKKALRDERAARQEAIDTLRSCFAPGYAPRRFDPGQDVLAASTQDQQLYLFRYGKALATLPGPSGHRRPVSRYRMGQWIGVLALYRRMRRARDEREATSPAARSAIAARWDGVDAAAASADARVCVIGHLQGEPDHVMADVIAFDTILPQLETHPLLRAWLSHQVAVRGILRGPVLQLLSAHPQLRGLIREDLEGLMQLGKLVRQEKLPGPTPPYQPAGKPRDRVALILRGDARAYTRVDGELQLVARFSVGDLLGTEDLVTEEDVAFITSNLDKDLRKHTVLDPTPRDALTEIHLSPGTVLVEFSWLAVRCAVAARVDALLPAVLYHSIENNEASASRASLALFAGQVPRLGTTILALSAAVAHAKHVAQRKANDNMMLPLLQGMGPPEGVWVVDMAAPQCFASRYGAHGCRIGRADMSVLLDTDAPPYLPDAPVRTDGAAHHQQFCEAVPRAADEDNIRDRPELFRTVRVVWAQEQQDTLTLVQLLRARPDGHFVVVRLPDAPTDPEQGQDMRRVFLERLVEPGVFLGWVHQDPDYRSYPVDWAVPDGFAYIDRVNPAYVQQALEGAREVRRRWALPEPPVDRAERFHGRHIVRILDDPQGAALAAELKFETLYRRGLGRADDGERLLLGTAMQRLSRAARGELVGLALGGGGVWGAAHVALLRTLTEGEQGTSAPPLPIDLIAGTSFGALVGGMYAVGGLKALEDFAASESIQGTGKRAWLRGVLGSQIFQATSWRAWVSSAAMQRMVDHHLRQYCTPQQTGGGKDPLLACTEIPFFPVSTALGEQRALTPRHGTVGWGVRAAGSLPPAIPGMRRYADEILDGAFVANVPAEVARDRGADFVISANVVGPIQSQLAHRIGTHPLLAKVWDASVFGRMGQYFRAYVLTQWQVGQDQGRLAANVRLDMFTAGVQMFEGWKMQAVDQNIDARIRKLGVHTSIRTLVQYPALWKADYYARIGRDGDEEGIAADLIGSALVDREGREGHQAAKGIQVRQRGGKA